MNRLLSISMLGFVAALILSWVGTSYAFSRRLHASACTPQSSSPPAWNLATTKGWRNSSNTTLKVTCPIPDDTSLKVADVVSMNVHGATKLLSVVSVSACFSAFNDEDAGSCGSAASTSGDGEFSLTPQLWRAMGGYDPSDFSYVVVTLPGNSEVVANLRGIYLRD